MRQITVWTKDETENLFTIAVNNSQVFYILGDMDVKAFYQKLLNGCKVPSENAEKIKARIEETDRLWKNSKQALCLLTVFFSEIPVNFNRNVLRSGNSFTNGDIVN